MAYFWKGRNMKKYYTIKATYANGITYTMDKRGNFFLALQSESLPKLTSPKEARHFFNTKAHLHHLPALKYKWIEGPRGGAYKLN